MAYCASHDTHAYKAYMLK